MLLIGMAAGAVLLGIIGFFLLAGLPLERSADEPSFAKRSGSKPIEVVEEAAPPPVVTDLRDRVPAYTPALSVSTAVAYPAAASRVSQAVAIEPPLSLEPPMYSSARASRASLREEESETAAMSESEAVNGLIPIARPFYRETEARCVAFRSLGYRNGRYTVDVRDVCSDQPLGRWQYDTRTGEALRFSGGRYQKP